jgi:hypothetical protein
MRRLRFGVCDHAKVASMKESSEESNTESASVDISLIDEMLRLSPAERLRQNDRMAALAAKLKSSFLAGQERWLNRET